VDAPLAAERRSFGIMRSNWMDPTAQTFVVTLAWSGSVSAHDFVLVDGDQYLQVCRAGVESSGQTSRLLLGLARDSSSSEILKAALTRALASEAPGAQAVLVTESQEGSAVAMVEDESEWLAVQAAAEIGVVRTWWGWDESATIKVCINGHTWDSSPRYNGEQWTAVVASGNRV
jgi:O-methyltransferase involved in polyketide biosynthesis